MTAHCLFEQSGTFRDAFRKHGIPARCYDIRNDYGKTDVQIDIFQEIRDYMSGGGNFVQGHPPGGHSHGVFPVHLLQQP